jgi:hypothetical protein
MEDTVDLTQVSKEDLKIELARREEQERQQIITDRRVRFDALIRNRAALLDLIPHSRSSCSDDNVANGLYTASYGPRCVRCGLLEMDEYSYERHDFDLQLNIIEVELAK